MVFVRETLLAEYDGKGKTDDEFDLVCKRFFILLTGICIYHCGGCGGMYYRCEMEKEQRCQSCCTDGHERTGRRRRREDSRMMSLDGDGLKVRPAGLAFSVLQNLCYEAGLRRSRRQGWGRSGCGWEKDGGKNGKLYDDPVGSGSDAVGL